VCSCDDVRLVASLCSCHGVLMSCCAHVTECSCHAVLVSCCARVMLCSCRVLCSCHGVLMSRNAHVMLCSCHAVLASCCAHVLAHGGSVLEFDRGTDNALTVCGVCLCQSERR